ncbi:MAG: PKD domain-containing protein [Oscillibacter sp.]|nr:PKD domain-containing protein [Oscillibacter sp.]
MTTMKNILWLLSVCLLCSIDGLGQTGGPELMWDGREEDEREILICNLEGKSFTVDVDLKILTGAFKDGTYKLEYGNGEVKNGLKENSFPVRVEYKEAGEFSLVFSAETSDGRILSTIYKVRTVKRPVIKLVPENTDVKCVGSEITYLVDVYDENPSGTKYTLDFDDETVLTMTNEELKSAGGKFKHVYGYSYCEPYHTGRSKEYFEVLLTVSNECGPDFDVKMNYQEKVVEKIQAGFTFSKFDGKNCTFSPVELRNITSGGRGIDCNPTKINYEWDFGNGETSILKNPSVSYEEARENEYKIRLIATNGYECARDTATEGILIVDRVRAEIEPEKDVVCAGELLQINNRGTLFGEWVVTSLTEGHPRPKYDPNSVHLKLNFDYYGKYKVTYIVENSCSSDQADTVITVRQNPNLSRYDIPEKACLPEAWNMSDFVNVSWNGNEEKAEWTITRTDGLKNEDVEWLDGTSVTSVFPVVRFKKLGEYSVKVQLPDVGCGGTKLTETKTIMVYDPNIEVKIDTTPLNICENGTVAFTNSSVGDNLQYEWSVSPMKKVNFITPTNNESASPVIEFGMYGDYEVKLHMYTHSGCGEVDTVYKVHVRKDPSIFFFEPPEAVCPGPDYPFSFSSSVIYLFYNNPGDVKWIIQPNNGGWEFLNGSNENSLYPELLFHTPGNYQFTVEVGSAGCPEEGIDRLLTKSIRVRNSAMSMTGEVLDAQVCEGDSLYFTLKATTAENDPLVYAWSVSPVDGETRFGITGNNKKAATVIFHHYGDYEVRGAVSGYCGTLDTTFQITVQKDPRVRLLDHISLCQGEYDMKEYVTYQWFNNTPEVKWTVRKTSGGAGNNGYTIDNSQIEYPKIVFTDPGDYSVRVEVVSHTVGCDADSLQDIKTFHIYDPEIKGDITMVGDGEICEGQTVSFMNTTNADGGVRWEWRVEGQEDGYVFQDGGEISTDQMPVITFSKYGDYQVYAKAIGACRAEEFDFSVTVSGVPEVTIADVSGVCEPFDFEGRELITIDSRNDAIRAAQWTIAEKPGSVSEGYEYLGASSETSVYPDIRFHHGEYELKVEYWNRCQTPGVKAFHIRADEFVPITKIEDDAICSQSPETRLLKAEPDTGVWSLKDMNIPNVGEIIVKRDGRYYFNPKFGAYDEQDVQLVYKLYNYSCVDTKEMTMHIWPLPYVEAGEPLEMCLNHEPQLLVGRDSVKGAVWQPNRGQWDLNGNILAEHYFTAERAGDFKVFYRYEDLNHCMNVDSTVMTVHVLPNTDFISQPQYCRGVLAEFVVNKSPEEKQYIWEYYTGAGLDVLPGNGGHVYEQAGYYDVTLIAESVHGCLDTSSVHRIEVIEDAPQADFMMSTHNECGPEVELHIGVTEANYSDHNLHFEWILGNGTISDALVPPNPQLFYSTLEDTVYQVKFRVYNICNETSKVDSLVVGSVPHVHFRFENGERNCSPLTLKVLNISTGSNNKYVWHMGDGTEPLHVFEPMDYLYVTDTARRVFDVSLVAENQCGRDSLMQPLIVLAQTLRAFFNRPKDDICVGEEICFTNFTRDTARDITYKYWDFGDEVRDTSWNACHVYRDSGMYKVLLFVDNGCSSDTTSKYVHVIGNPKLELLVEQEHCDRDTFHFAFTTDQKLRWIKWNLGDDSTVFAPSFSYVYKESGSYPVVLEVIGENRADCASREEMLLSVYPRPVLRITPFDTLVCPPYLFQPQVEGEAARLMWDYGDGSPETSAEEHLYINETDSLLHYILVLHAFSDKGCPEDFTGAMRVANLPHAEIEKQVTNGRPQKVDLFNLSPEGYVDYIWILPEDKVVHTIGNQHFEFMENGVYNFSLITENEYTCRDTATLEHEVLLKGLYFPNTFIPHSQNGKINKFNGIGMGLQYYKLEIFDQYRNKLWETEALQDGKPSEGWDGCNPKGKPMPQGIYIWRAKAIFGNDDVWTGKNNESGVAQTTQGTVLLLRE